MKNRIIISLLLLGFLVNAQETDRPRTVLLESFSSSTCGPCNSANKLLKSVFFENSGSYVLIKYQMYWPEAGDPYYTKEGDARKNLYLINTVPWIRCDGSAFSNGQTPIITNSKLEELQNIPANIDMEIDYSIEGKKVNATVAITPKIYDASSSLKLYIAIVERITYKNFQTNGEKEFYQVMKKFMPDAEGISIPYLAADLTMEFEQEWTFQGDYRCPQNALNPINHNSEHSVENFENLAIVAWIQNTDTKRVHQACQKSFKQLIALKTKDSNGTIFATANGTQISNEGLVNAGTDVVFTAVPNLKYAVKNWRVNGVIVDDNSTNELIISNVSKDSYVSVEFEKTQFDVQFSAFNNGGTISATVEGEPVESNETFDKGTRVVFTANPNPGYKVSIWRQNDVILNDISENEYVIESLEFDVNVTVAFSRNDKLLVSVKINPENAGTVTGFEGAFDPNDKVTLSAIPNEGWKFLNWKKQETIVSNALEYSFTITEDVTLTANFESLENIKVESLSETILYPNPFNDIIYISGNLDIINKVYISNMLGQRIKEIHLNGKSSFSTDNLPKGIYIITFERKDRKIETVKMIKR